MSERIDILLVDDEPRNLDALGAILDDPEYNLLRASDADSALKLLLEHDVAAILLDVKMPGTSGIELAQMIKATRRYRQIPIVFLTAYLLDDKDIITGYGAGAVDYLTKPLQPEIVRHKVAVFADLYRKTRALAELNESLEQRVSDRTAELQRSEEALREADRRKDEFIAMLAHELRNPLAPLVFGMEILDQSHQRAGTSTPRVTKTLGTMRRQLDHMVRLIDDLLDASRVSRGAIELHRERTDLATTIQTAVDINRPHVERRRLRLAVSAPPGLCTEGDPTRIAQIVSNLLHNATKFTPEGGDIRIELARDGADALVRVADSGEGIDAQQIEHLFGMFSRVERATSRAERGLGIGLALARRLAEMHGGTLTGSSDGVGHGATFTLRLPLVESGPVLAVVPPSPVAPAPSGDGLEIVVIEDSDDVAETLTLLLESMGHHVSVASTGPTGLDLVERTRPRLVLCDIGLPDFDGVEVCRRVRRLALVEQPVMVALTGWGREEDQRRTREAGFDRHLVKPVAPEKLREVIAATVGE